MSRERWAVLGGAGIAALAVASLLVPGEPEFPPVVSGARLDRPFATSDDRSDSVALGDFRLDPAPATVVPRLTEAEALALFRASDFGSTGSAPGATVVARFGLFTGNVANPPALDGTLTGTHYEQGQPAWLIVIEGLGSVRRGGARNPDGLPPPPPAPERTTAATVVSDTGRGLLTGLHMRSVPAG